MDLTTETGLPDTVALAIKYDRQATFHPRKFLLAIAEEITKLGGKIYINSRVKDKEEASGFVKLMLENGR